MIRNRSHWTAVAREPIRYSTPFGRLVSFTLEAVRGVADATLPRWACRPRGQPFVEQRALVHGQGVAYLALFRRMLARAEHYGFAHGIGTRTDDLRRICGSPICMDTHLAEVLVKP